MDTRDLSQGTSNVPPGAEPKPAPPGAGDGGGRDLGMLPLFPEERGCARESPSPSTRPGSKASSTAPVSGPAPRPGAVLGAGRAGGARCLRCPGGGPGGRREGSPVTGPGSPTVEGDVSLHARFVSTDYSHLILYVRLEDAGEVTSLWALLGRRWPSPAPGCPRALCLLPRCSWAAQGCTPVGVSSPVPLRRDIPARTPSLPQESIQLISCLLRVWPGRGTPVGAAGPGRGTPVSRNPPLASPGR